MTYTEIASLIRKLSRRRHMYMKQVVKWSQYPVLYTKEIQTARKMIAEIDADIARYIGKLPDAPSY